MEGPQDLRRASLCQISGDAAFEQETQLGTPIEAALWRAAKTVQTDEFNFLIVAMSIQRDTGGNLAETLANLSALLRALAFPEE